MPTFAELITTTRGALNARIAAVNSAASELDLLRAQEAPDVARIDKIRAERAAAEVEVQTLRTQLADLERESADDDKQTLAASIVNPVSRTVSHITTTERAKSALWVRSDGSPAALERGAAFIDHPAVAREVASRSTADAAVIGQHGNLGQLVRALSTTSGSATVPTVWAADIIDLARAKSATAQAGATIVPMDAKTVQIGRLAADPTAAFRTEGSAITASDPTLDNVTLTAKTLSSLVVVSLEWAQDTIDTDVVLTNAIAEAIASQLDLVALYGGITTGAGATVNLPAPNPTTGLLASLLAVGGAPNVLGATAGVTATNGTPQTALAYYDQLVDLVYRVRQGNYEPSGIVWAPRAAQQYGKAYDSQGQPVRAPQVLDGIPRYETNRVPTYTQGTLTTATDVFAGDWSQLLIGTRLGIDIQVLTERYADNGQIGIVANFRGDIALARPSAFAAFKALRGA